MTGIDDLEALEQYAVDTGNNSPPRVGREAKAAKAAASGSATKAGLSSAEAAPSSRTTAPHQPAPTQERPSKRGRAAEHSGHGKKQKGGKSPHAVRSPKLDLLGLTDQDCARFKEEPFEVMSEAIKAAGALFKKCQEGESARVEGMRLAFKHSMLEDAYVDKNFKLNSALSMLAEMREQRDSLAQKLQDLDPQIKALAENEWKLREAEEQLVAQVAGRSEAEAARAEAEAARERAIAEKADFEKEAEKEVGRLTSLNKGLYSEVTALKEERDDLQARFKDVLTRAKGAAEAQFENVINQLKLLNPGLVVDPHLVSSSHRAVEREIILPERKSKGQIVQERALIFRAPDA